jgi:hypothetical protein
MVRKTRTVQKSLLLTQVTEHPSVPNPREEPVRKQRETETEKPVAPPAPGVTSSQPLNYIDQIRALPAISAVLHELQKQAGVLRVDRSVLQELERYCATKQVIPEILSADRAETVEKAQQGLQELQARLDRVAAIHLGVRKLQRALQKLETMARHELAVQGHLTPKTSKPSADQLVALALPELQNHQDAWETFSKICRDVQEHVGSAKDVIRIQMKLDENLHWAQRSGA